MDKAVILNKLESLRRCVLRVEDKTPPSLAGLVSDADLQDIIVLNLERAVQTSVDIALHVISHLDVTPAETMRGSFETLRDAGYIDASTCTRMTKAVGFRNVAVHAYQEIDWEIVYMMITKNMNDFRMFAQQMNALVD
ncbi:DUF86 domain-containing protein [Verrucomicrobiaceae bacterium N1E253]|uniref:DUF86 domain-containing protein n=1 Tax=Oceaniferula marina TaxID=2748318 RepID=A0A851GBP1_9BACT|nr:DUF86 domain-containing protein [Oceaniferula marina]NWK55158.1 DUF86 domain-containing protein [Oceaniferula marina]